MYTLVHIDPDITDPHYGTTERPWMQWLVTNIPLGRVDMGRVVVPYGHAISGFGENHRVLFLLYRQTKWLINTNPFLYTPLCTDVGYRERYDMLDNLAEVCYVFFFFDISYSTLKGDIFYSTV